MENREGEYWLLLASTILEHRVEDLGVPGSNLLNALRPVLLMPRTAAWWAVREKVAQTTQATRLACVLHMGTHTYLWMFEKALASDLRIHPSPPNLATATSTGTGTSTTTTTTTTRMILDRAWE